MKNILYCKILFLLLNGHSNPKHSQKKEAGARLQRAWGLDFALWTVENLQFLTEDLRDYICDLETTVWAGRGMKTQGEGIILVGLKEQRINRRVGLNKWGCPPGSAPTDDSRWHKGRTWGWQCHFQFGRNEEKWGLEGKHVCGWKGWILLCSHRILWNSQGSSHFPRLENQTPFSGTFSSPHTWLLNFQPLPI